MPAAAKLLGAGARLLDAAAGGLLVAILAITLAQVAVRYALGGSLAWSEELTRLLFVWMVMVAAVRARHIRIDYFERRLPARARRALALVLLAITLVVLAVMVRGAWSMAELTARDTYTGLPVSVKYLFLAVFWPGLLWMLAVVGRAPRSLRRGEGG